MEETKTVSEGEYRSANEAIDDGRFSYLQFRVPSSEFRARTAHLNFADRERGLALRSSKAVRIASALIAL